MVVSEVEITKLIRVRKTLMQMLRDRGYNVSDDEIEMTKDDLLEKYGENMTRKDLFIVKSLRDSSEQIYVFFDDKRERKVGVQIIRTYTERMQRDGVHSAILVVNQQLTKFARIGVHEISSKFHLEVFKDDELLLNVKEQVLVPEHISLTPEEKKALLERYTVKETQLPKIHATDPIARYYGLRQSSKLSDLVRLLDVTSLTD